MAIRASEVEPDRTHTPTSTSGPGDRARVGLVVHAMQVAGAEVLVTETVRALRDRIEPTVLCLDEVGPLGEELREEGVDVVCLDRRPGLDLAVARRLAGEARRRHLEIVHAHQYTPFFYSALARLLCLGSFRLILTEHGRHSPDRVSARRRWINRLVLARQADAVNACSEFSARALWQLDGFAESAVALIPNGIRVEPYGRAPDRDDALRRLGLTPERRYLAAVGRFHPVKDHQTLLRAFAEVSASHDDVDLLLVGDGPLRSDLESLCAGLGIGERVRFLGLRRDVPGILSAVDLFALTSLSEAASLTLLEAMASSLPSVVTRVGGNPEILRHETEGLLIERGDVAGAAAAIRRLLDDPDVAAAMGDAARRRVESHYRLEDTLRAYLELYRRLAAGGGLA